MKTYRRILVHAGFWLLYLAVIIFNDLFLSPSFVSSPEIIWVYKSLLSQTLLLTVKIAAVYYTLYAFIPRWLKSNQKIRLTVEAIFVSVLLVAFYRIIIRYIIWPYIHEIPPAIPGLSMIARYFYSFLDILQVAGIAAAIKLARLRIEAIRNEKALIQEKLSSEIRHLKSQINPHFLFNTLNSLYAQARSGSPDNASSILKLSGIMRYMLYESEKNLTGIDAELKNIEDYIALQQLRFGDRVKIIREIQLDENPVRITPLLILPLIENAYKHGAEKNTGATEIRMAIRQENDILNIEISNNFPAENAEKHSAGIGLSNIKRQLELLYRNHSFEIRTGNNIFRVHILIHTNSYAGTELSDR